jgi:hypothetical protein
MDRARNEYKLETSSIAGVAVGRRQEMQRVTEPGQERMVGRCAPSAARNGASLTASDLPAARSPRRHVDGCSRHRDPFAARTRAQDKVNGLQ